MKQGWHPVWAIKNCVVQNDMVYGVNGFKVATCNMNNSTYIALYGFWKQLSNDEKDIACISIMNNNKVITAKNQFILEH